LSTSFGKPSSGIFITVEGGDGAGKSTQVKRLAEHLETLDMPLTMTREPGGVGNAEKIRDFFLNHDGAPWESWTEAFLIAAARREHVAQLIRPKLMEGGIVLCDRFSDSTLAYQGYGRGLPMYDLSRLVEMAEQGVTPDLTIVLDIDPAIAKERIAQRGAATSSFEGAGAAFQSRIRQAYLDFAREDSYRYRVIDAGRSEAEVAADIRSVTDTFISERQAIA